MKILSQILQYIQQGVTSAGKFITMVWKWAFNQIASVPWQSIGELPLWKILLLIVVAGGIIYLLYKSLLELFEAGQKALGAIATLFSVLIQTILPLILAGALATVGAYIVNNIHF
jgi:hypothetical protein